MDVEAALARKAEGYRMVVLANDITVVGQGLRSAVASYRAG